MKVAIVHELFTTKGGAEHVALVLANHCKQADIFTLSYNKQLFKTALGNRKVHTPFLSQLLPSTGAIHHVLAPKYARDVRKWDFSAYDLVISSSSSFAHQITVPATTKHITYIHSPARYLWDSTQAVRNTLQTGTLGTIKTWYFDWLAHRLREQDASCDHSNTTLLAASKEVQRRIELYWRNKSTVVYPPIANIWHTNEHTQAPSRAYFAVASTLAPYKQIDLAINACNQAKLPLKIAGEGPAKTYLQSIAGPTIEFVGRLEQSALKDFYYNAKAIIFPGNEDFGLVPLEAMSQGTPVIGQAIGGALETITHGINGLLFTEPTVESLLATLHTFNEHKFSSEECKNTVKPFSEAKFIQTIESFL